MHIEFEVQNLTIKILIDNDLCREVYKSFFIRHLSQIKTCHSLSALNELVTKIEEKAAKGEVLRLLAIRSYFISEVRKKLQWKKISDETIDKVLTHYAHYFNDEERATRLIEKELRKGYGPYVIAQKLQSICNLSPAVHRELMADVEKRQIETLQKLKNKSIASLKRRGFTSDAIRRIYSE